MDEALGLRADGLPSGGALLVTDEVAASGGWLVAHFLRRALADAAAGSEADARGPGSAAGSAEAAPRRAVCLVAADQDLAHYAQALRKLGRNVHAELASGRLVVVDALSLPYDWCRDAAGDAPASTSAPSSAAPGVRAWSAPTDDPVPGRSLFAAVEAALGRAQPSPAGGGGVPPGVPPDGAPARRVVVFESRRWRGVWRRRSLRRRVSRKGNQSGTRPETPHRAATGRGVPSQRRRERDKLPRARHVWNVRGGDCPVRSGDTPGLDRRREAQTQLPAARTTRERQAQAIVPGEVGR